ncbi:hypothetical protein [Paenibacillus naphthalenovorans]|uniref:hypothetical protein n=1 Tax=Paenibacillus naphthalenovorans TaxID=162209 RepID=UPI003D2DDF97
MAANTGIHIFLAGYTPKPAMVSGFLFQQQPQPAAKSPAKAAGALDVFCSLKPFAFVPSW